MPKIPKIVEIRTECVCVKYKKRYRVIKKGTRKQQNKRTYWNQVNLYDLESC